jgi:hypothetical protein
MTSASPESSTETSGPMRPRRTHAPACGFVPCSDTLQMALAAFLRTSSVVVVHHKVLQQGPPSTTDYIAS